MSIDPQEARAVFENADQLYSQGEVEEALDRMAVEITGKLKDANPLVLCVMNGALIPLGRLLTHLKFPLRQDYIHASRYQGKTSGSKLEWISRPRVALRGQNVLIFDDILDEGVTLHEIVNYCWQEGANSVLSAVLVQKAHQRGNGIQADFVGLEVEDRYVFGYGMDYKGYLRNVPGIYAVEKIREIT